MRNDIVKLTPEQKQFLITYSSTGVRSARAIRRAQTLLLADQGMLQKDIAAQFGCHPVTISETIRRYHQCEGNIEEALTEKPRPGQPSKITPEIEAQITAMACEQEGPHGRGRWNLRLMSKRLVELEFVENISPETVRQVLKSQLKPWQKKQWCIGKIDGDYLAAMEAVLSLYNQPAQAGVVRLCMDEQPCQLLSDVMTPLPASPGSVQKTDYEYKREGTCVVLLIYDIDQGKRYTQVREQRTKKDYAEFINQVVAKHYSDVTTIRLVQDNLNTHKKGSFYEHLPKERAAELSALIDFVFTPKHGSWLNMAETEFSALSRQCMDRRIGSIEALRAEVCPWTAQRNKDEIRINWTFTVSDAREKLSNRYKDVNPDN